MTATLKNKWIAEMRSGKWHRRAEYFRQRETHFRDPVGVLLEVLKPGRPEPDIMSSENVLAELTKAGIAEYLPELAHLNDRTHWQVVKTEDDPGGFAPFIEWVEALP